MLSGFVRRKLLLRNLNPHLIAATPQTEPSAPQQEWEHGTEDLEALAPYLEKHIEGQFRQWKGRAIKWGRLCDWLLKLKQSDAHLSEWNVYPVSSRTFVAYFTCRALNGSLQAFENLRTVFHEVFEHVRAVRRGNSKQQHRVDLNRGR